MKETRTEEINASKYKQAANIKVGDHVLVTKKDRPRSGRLAACAAGLFWSGAQTQTEM